MPHFVFPKRIRIVCGRESVRWNIVINIVYKRGTPHPYKLQKKNFFKSLLCFSFLSKYRHVFLQKVNNNNNTKKKRILTKALKDLTNNKIKILKDILKSERIFFFKCQIGFNPETFLVINDSTLKNYFKCVKKHEIFD